MDEDSTCSETPAITVTDDAHAWPEYSKPPPTYETTVPRVSRRSRQRKFKISSEPCFDGEYLLKHIKLEKKYDTHQDFLQALKDGAFDDLLKNDKRYDGIQFRVQILTEKVTDTGKVKKDSFYICTDLFNLDSKSEYLDKVFKQVIIRAEKHNTKGSGLHHSGVEEFEIATISQTQTSHSGELS